MYHMSFDITRNLLSLSKLVDENNIIVEFDKNCCFMNDKLTGETILRGTLKNDLYQLWGFKKIKLLMFMSKKVGIGNLITQTIKS